MTMRPPKTLNVLDEHGGFTALTYEQDTLWRPGRLLQKTTIGTLDEVNEHSFYQTNNNVTKAIYKVPGYRLRVVVWFDNASGKRIA